MPSGFYWGGLAQGLGQGMQDIAKLQQEQELNKLKQKMINATLAVHQAQAQKFMQEVAQAEQARRIQDQTAGNYQAAVTGGAPGVPAHEDVSQQMSVADVPAQAGPKAMSPEQSVIYGLLAQGKVPPGELFKQSQPGQVHIPEGSFIPDPTAPGGFRQLGAGKTQNERPISVAPGGTVINPRTGEPMFTAPSKPEKPERPITVAPGGTVLDPRTGKPIFTAPERPPSPTKDVPPITNFKSAKQQLEDMADALKLKQHQIGNVKSKLETKANELGYTIQGVRPSGMFSTNSWALDIAPISPSQRGGKPGAGQQPTKEQRLKGLGFE